MTVGLVLAAALLCGSQLERTAGGAEASATASSLPIKSPDLDRVVEHAAGFGGDVFVVVLVLIGLFLLTGSHFLLIQLPESRDRRASMGKNAEAMIRLSASARENDARGRALHRLLWRFNERFENTADFSTRGLRWSLDRLTRAAGELVAAWSADREGDDRESRVHLTRAAVVLEEPPPPESDPEAAPEYPADDAPTPFPGRPAAPDLLNPNPAR